MFDQSPRIEMKVALALIAPLILIGCQSAPKDKEVAAESRRASFAQEDGWGRAGVLRQSPASVRRMPAMSMAMRPAPRPMERSSSGAAGFSHSQAEMQAIDGVGLLGGSNLHSGVPGNLLTDQGSSTDVDSLPMGPDWPPVVGPVTPPPPAVPLVEVEPPSAGGGVRLRFKGEPGDLHGLMWKSDGPNDSSPKSGINVWLKFRGAESVKVYEAYCVFSASELASLNSAAGGHSLTISIMRVKEVGKTEFIKVRDIKGRLSGVCVQGHIWYTTQPESTTSITQRMDMYSLVSL